MRTGKILALLAVGAIAVSSYAQTFYNNRATFEAALTSMVKDGFDNEGYGQGDVVNQPTLDIHSDAHMSAVIGETDYNTTGFTNWNIIYNQPGDPRYCAGCNGSFRLIFTSTSQGDANGVFGVGFDVEAHSGSYVAYITYGDGGTENANVSASGQFWGVTTTRKINNIHFGLANGGRRTDGSFGIDDLTIGAPEPTTLSLLALGGLALLRRRR